MMKQKLSILLISFITVCNYSCKKDTVDGNVIAIIGNWRYTNSTVDSNINGQWKIPVTGYDSSVIDIFADSLTFTAKDTVYYTYLGITAWSNYSVNGSKLTLIGSASNNILVIHNITNTTLQIGYQTDTYNYWMNFTKY
ncbi:MAG TPA: hypothetical protein VHP12_07130 [Chitinophagaceae bacterium]|nr:hypothetical protein [Chitinophagaceae bacterium]